MSLRILLLLVVLHGAAGFAFLKDTGPGFPLDDTWLHMVYARSFGEGGGFAYNDGQLETGVTAPLWTALLAVPVGLSELVADQQAAFAAGSQVVESPRVRPDSGVRLLGGLMGLFMAFVGWRLSSRAGTWPAVFVGLILTFDPMLMFDRFSGMELPLFGLLTLMLAGALMDGRENRAAVLSGLLVFTRPEGVLLILVGLVWFIRRRQRWARYLGISLLFLIPWALYCYLVSGRFLPATIETKAAAVFDVSGIFGSTWALFQDTGWGWALPVAGIVGVFSLEGGRHTLGMLCLSMASILFLGVLFTRPLLVSDNGQVPFYWARYAHIAWPLVLVLVATGVSAIVRTAWAGVLCRPHYAIALVTPLLVLGFLGRDLPAHARDRSARFAAECEHVEELNVAAGVWISQHTTNDAVVATHDAGAVKFFGRRKVIDIFGNQNHEFITRERQGPEALRDWLLAQDPDVLVVFPALWARNHSPELANLWRDLPPMEGADLVAASDDYAEFFGLTKRAVTFHVDSPVTVPSPLHADMAIFVRP
jgi:hypothetical protein